MYRVPFAGGEEERRLFDLSAPYDMLRTERYPLTKKKKHEKEPLVFFFFCSFYLLLQPTISTPNGRALCTFLSLFSALEMDGAWGRTQKLTHASARPMKKPRSCAPPGTEYAWSDLILI